MIDKNLDVSSWNTKPLTDFSGIFANCKSIPLTISNLSWKNDVINIYEYKQFKIHICFDKSDINERYIYYWISYEKNIDKIIFDRESKKLWFNWHERYSDKEEFSNKKEFYECNERSIFSDYHYYYLMPRLSIKEILRERKLISNLKKLLFRIKNYNNKEFKDFLLKIYERESIERIL